MWLLVVRVRKRGCKMKAFRGIDWINCVNVDDDVEGRGPDPGSFQL